MSVLIEAQTLVILRDRLEAVYPGGLDGFLTDSGNATLRADDYLCAEGFMASTAIDNRVGELEELGLVGEKDGAWVDMTIVLQDRGVLGTCDWLEFHRMPDGQCLAWLKGTDPGECATPEGWDLTNSRSMRYYSPEDTIRYLRYLGSEGGIDVSLDVRTGTKLYTARGSGEPAAGFLPHRTRWLERRLHELAEPDCEVSDERARGELDEIAQETGFYSALAGSHQAYAMFVQGLALRMAGRWAEAERAFLGLVDMYGDDPDVWLELTWCLGAQGKYDAALEAVHRALAGSPDSAVAWGSLAATLVRMGRIPEARGAVARALELDPEEEISLRVLTVLDG